MSNCRVKISLAPVFRSCRSKCRALRSLWSFAISRRDGEFRKVGDVAAGAVLARIGSMSGSASSSSSAGSCQDEMESNQSRFVAMSGARSVRLSASDVSVKARENLGGRARVSAARARLCVCGRRRAEVARAPRASPRSNGAVLAD